ncbi:hypothetical protein ARMSODRAFT_1016031 [Armillaria solidipes]|uniref:Uncharacterized protein n=1 Tax=Armillaria solidipes TaxID=1076256 RepID=A0A2H3C5D5_9AGAR|nr:hypothetical protein ARMSODRAFT_1016031 [Armillaria solidipes]
MEQACGMEPLLAASHSPLSLPLLPSRSTLDTNTNGGNSGSTLVDHEGDVYAGVDLMTGIHPGAKYGDLKARPQVHSATGGDSPPRPMSRHRMIARWDRVPSEIAKAVVLGSRKQRLAKIMDCCHYSPDTPTEGGRPEDLGMRDVALMIGAGYGVDRNSLR